MISCELIKTSNALYIPFSCYNESRQPGQHFWATILCWHSITKPPTYGHITTVYDRRGREGRGVYLTLNAKMYVMCAILFPPPPWTWLSRYKIMTICWNPAYWEQCTPSIRVRKLDRFIANITSQNEVEWTIRRHSKLSTRTRAEELRIGSGRKEASFAMFNARSCYSHGMTSLHVLLHHERDEHLNRSLVGLGSVRLKGWPAE